MSDLGFGFYTPEVLEHFQRPHNAVPVKNPDAVGEVGNIACGDMMRMTIKVKRELPKPEMGDVEGLGMKKSEAGREAKELEELVITEIGFQTYGCAAAIATSSITTDLALGKNFKEALEITKDQVVKSLTKLPPSKVHCSILAVDALGEAIYQYLTARKIEVPEALMKRHEHVEKAQKILEERYREWSGGE